MSYFGVKNSVQLVKVAEYGLLEMTTPVWIIKAEDIKSVDAEDFQRLCFQLLDFEVSYRHVQGRVGGPPPKYHGDKGMDLSVEIVQSPRYKKSDFSHTLTEDAVAITCVACKGGDNWKTGLLDDAGKPAPIETVAGGGHFTMLTNRQVGEIETSEIMTKVPDIIGNTLSVSIEEIKPRIHFFDADDLASFYAYHFIRLDNQLRALLRIPNLHGLLGFDEWRTFLQQTRDLPDFSPDDLRSKSIQQLREILNRETGSGVATIWVYGPPGVGKSRLVFEAVYGQASVAPRVLVSSDFEFGRRAIAEYEVPTYNNVVLIVDECPAHQAQSLCALFQARAQGQNGTLILIGVQESPEEPEGFPGLRIRLSPLEEEATRKLVEHEIGIGTGQESDLVQRVLSLSEGYPWFAILLARALRTDRTALPHGSVHWNAAELAIAGTQKDFGDDADSWQKEILIRAKSLLAVMLTKGIDWSHLDIETQNRFGQAVDLPWSEVIRAAEVCWKRGILRQRQNWKYKYVTPKNLARLAAVSLLTAPLSLGIRIKEYAPELRKDLHRQLESIEVPDSLLKELAANEINTIPEEGDPFDLLLPKPSGFLPLQFMAKWQPGPTASWLHQIIEPTTIEELQRRTDIRRDLVFALAHITHRRDGFEDAEASLFRLGAAENETWANNATGVWSGLFLVAINLTHRKFDVRLEILRKRVKEGSLEHRIIALAGLGSATSRESAGPGYSPDDKIDGPWDLPTIGEVQQGKREAWSLLCSMTLDQDAALAGKSKEIVIHNLRSTIRWGIGEDVFGMLSEIIDKWQEKELADLRAELDSIKRYEAPAIKENTKLAEAISRLRVKTEPVDYHGRLLDIVGRWSPGDKVIDTEPTSGYGERLSQYEEKLDKQIAEEGLASPTPLVNELKWLESDEAKRGVPFMIHVGLIDSKRVLLEPLIEHAKAGGVVNIMSAYLTGLARSGREKVVDELLQNWRDEPSLALHTLMIIWRVGANEKRINWLIEDLEKGNLDPNAVGCLALASWGRQSKPEPIKKLIETLAKFPSLTPQITALDLILERSEPELDLLEPTLIALVKRLAALKLTGMSDYTWEQGCKLLLKRGRVKEGIETAIIAIGASEDFGSDEHVWRVLEEAVKLDPAEVWEGIMPLLSTRDQRSYRMILESQRYAIISRIPINIIMDWVGSDKRRSIIVADMCSAHERPLNEIASHLIMKFGADSPAARVLASRAYSTPGVVSSIAGFMKSQLENAMHWAEDKDPEVAKWGQELVAELQRSYEAESAREEFEERES